MTEQMTRPDQITVRTVAAALAPFLPITPLVKSTLAGVEREVWIKCENLQPTGSFKVRPAFWGILSHLAEARQKGVVTSSSGNFAQAVAYAAKMNSLQASIVMTEDTAAFKVERTRQWCAQVILCGPSFEQRWEKTREVQTQTGAWLLHPYDSWETITADATVGLEIFDQLCVAQGVQDPRQLTPFSILVPTSGGGLVAGIALAVSLLGVPAEVIGIQPAVNASMAKSLAVGERIKVGNFRTMADALVAAQPGEKTFALLQELGVPIWLVDEAQIRLAQETMVNECKIWAEPAGAIPLVPLLSRPSQASEAIQIRDTVVLVASGGNFRFEL